MPRHARVVLPGIAHHIVQRGNNRQWVFDEEKDFTTYCYLINKYAQKYKVSIIAYCLMSNHVHFVSIPEDENGLARLFNTVHMRYAQYKNFKRKTNGHLWQGRFFSSVCDITHLYQVIRYVEQNPVRARLVQSAWDYPWSSAGWHVQRKVKKYIKLCEIDLPEKRHWKRYLSSDDTKVDEQIRRKTNMGKAFASEDFINHWEKKLGCVLRELKPGRRTKKGRK